MKVIAHAPSSWFLVRDGDSLLLDVACGTVGAFSLLIRLGDSEIDGLNGQGLPSVDVLATTIRNNPRAFSQRHERGLEAAVTAAIIQWKNDGVAVQQFIQADRRV
ncbi:hypothetical protein [Arenimonas sp.]|uniref:hypothetical protein n=1 Tax=Arenimonas sp. TaxID=1872635 RepID=UPI0039E35750